MRWRLSGIERDVYLHAYPRTTVWNFFLKPDLDSRYENGSFKAVVALRDFAGNSKGRGHVEMKLLDGAGTTVWKQKREFKMAGGRTRLLFRVGSREWPVGRRRPYIMCEYAHAQGNSNGNLKDIWDAVYDSPNLQGGFIWDFKDQGFKMRTEAQDGRTYWTYNGRMGSRRWLEGKPGEWNTGTDGILSADGTPKPQAWEVTTVGACFRIGNTGCWTNGTRMVMSFACWTVRMPEVLAENRCMAWSGVCDCLYLPREYDLRFRWVNGKACFFPCLASHLSLYC